ncbi:MAG: methylmalonyl-CoA mutase family protein [Dehalococcoidia bacterium]|nr:methylmalonyl-CoA mutase family protein [Dehalococcoidia bacterium]
MMVIRFRALKEEWEEEVVRKSPDYEKDSKGRLITDSGIEVKSLYTPLDLEDIGFDYARDLGFPGKFPFARGKDPLGYRQKPWLFGQYAAYGDAEESNKRYHFLLDHGGTSLSVALDVPTQLGYDSDHPLAEGEVGKVGVPLNSLEDMEILFSGIPLDRPRQIAITANANGPVFIALVIALAEKQGTSPQNFVLRLQNDILKEYVARGTFIFPPEPSVGITTDVIVYCAQNYPHWIPMSVSGYHMREAGADAVQEIAFTIANAIAYTDSCIAKGLKAEDYLSRLAVFLTSGIDFFEEVAKLRAMRRLWARTFEKRYSVSDPDLLNYFLSVMTAGSSLTAQQPMNNVVRVAIQSLAAVLGGCQVLNPCSMDEAYCTPTEQAVKVALRTQQIIASETGVTRTVDPLAGSYFVEHLTNELEKKAREYLDKIDSMGGAIKAIEKGYFQVEIARSAYKIKQQVESGARVVVGVNKYIDKDELPITILKVDPVLERKQKERLKRLKGRRNNLQVKETLKRVRQAAESGENLVPPAIEAIKAYATVGEICDALREVYGEYSAPSFF